MWLIGRALAVYIAWVSLMAATAQIIRAFTA